jgi:hypothetical protein
MVSKEPAASMLKADDEFEREKRNYGYRVMLNRYRGKRAKLRGL